MRYSVPPLFIVALGTQATEDVDNKITARVQGETTFVDHGVKSRKHRVRHRFYYGTNKNSESRFDTLLLTTTRDLCHAMGREKAARKAQGTEQPCAGYTVNY